MNLQKSYSAMQSEVARTAQRYYDQMNAVCVQRRANTTEYVEGAELSKCPLHDRTSYLWGGDMCDMCDKDGNGLIDCLESAVGIGPSPRNHSLFAPEEKGWAMITGACMERIPHNDPRQPQINASIRKSVERDMPLRASLIMTTAGVTTNEQYSQWLTAYGRKFRGIRS